MTRFDIHWLETLYRFFVGVGLFLFFVLFFVVWNFGHLSFDTEKSCLESTTVIWRTLKYDVYCHALKCNLWTVTLTYCCIFLTSDLTWFYFSLKQLNLHETEDVCLLTWRSAVKFLQPVPITRLPVQTQIIRPCMRPSCEDVTLSTLSPGLYILVSHMCFLPHLHNHMLHA